MFRINSADYSKMIDEYKSLETVLEEERENLQMLIESSGQTMSGEAVSAWQTGYQKTLDTGAYDEVLRQVRGLCTSMEDMQPLLNRMLEEGELLGEQLESDALLYPSGSRTYTGREAVLLLEETYASRIDAECEAIQDTGEAMRRTMQEVFRLCEGIIDLSDEKEQLDTACKHLKRVRNLQAAFRRYVRGVRDLDESLACLFQAYIDADAACVGTRLEGELLGAANAREVKELEEILQKPPLEWTGEVCALVAKSWEKAVEEGDIAAMEELLSACMEEGSGRFDYGVLSEMAGNCKGEVAAGILTRLIENKLPVWKYADCMVEIYEEEGILTVHVLQDVLLEEDNTVTVTAETNGGEVKGKQDIINRYGNYPEEYYEIAAGLLKKDAAGIYKFEELLKMDAGDVSAKERSILGALYRDKCHAIETAPSRECMEKQFDITEKMVEGLFRYQIYAENGKSIANPYVAESWRTAFAENIMDKQSMAYMMLAELQAFKPEEAPGWWSVEKNNPVVHASINPQMVSFTLQLDFVPVDIGSIPDSKTLYFTGKERAIQQVETLDESVMEHLTELGYTKQQILDMYLLSDSVSDEEFVDHLVKNEYKEAFHVNPEELGDEVKLLLSAYAAKLYVVQNGNGQLVELEKFINSMLYQDENCCWAMDENFYLDTYLELMVEQSGLLCKGNLLRIFNDNIGRKEAEWAVSMDNLWRALYIQYDESNIRIAEEYPADPFYSRGECLLQVKNLQTDSNGDISLTLMLCNEAYTEEKENELTVYNDMVFLICPEREVWESDQPRVRNKLRQLDKEIEMLWQKQSLKTVLDVVGIFAPQTVAGIETAIAMVKGNSSDAVKNLSNMELLKKYTAGTLKIPSKILCGFLDYQEKKTELQSQKDEIALDGMVPWFYTVEKYTVDGTEYYISEDINDYKVIRGIMKWNEEGCSSFVKAGSGENIEDAIFDFLQEEDETNREEIEKKPVQEQEKESLLSQEQWDALECMIFGVNNSEHPTEYDSVLQIDDELFISCVEKLDEALAGTLDSTIGMRAYWHDMLKEMGGYQ